MLDPTPTIFLECASFDKVKMGVKIVLTVVLFVVNNSLRVKMALQANTPTMPHFQWANRCGSLLAIYRRLCLSVSEPLVLAHCPRQQGAVKMPKNRISGYREEAE